MSQTYLDSQGRPVEVVTGMGLMTSLGAGVANNWRRLTAGESGIHRITRFALDNLRTTMAGTVDFLSADPMCAPELSERMAELVAEEAVAEAGIGSARTFPAPLFLAFPPGRPEWPPRPALTPPRGANPLLR